MEAFADWSVLVIDDSAPCIKMWCELLQSLGILGVLATSTSEALILLGATQFTLVVVDQHLSSGGRQGADLVRMIREGRTLQSQETPIVACTSDTSEATLLELKNAGVDAVLGKPLHVPSIVAAFSRIAATR